MARFCHGKEWKIFSRCRCREVVPSIQVRISCQGLWTKVKQMAAYCLSAVQCDGADRLLEKVWVIQADTLSMVQGGCTVGITTSQSVHLSANAYFVPEFTAMRYINYGAAISEVEINILTGETKMLQTDLIYDCGKSLNHAVDFGQIEGVFVQGIGFFMLLTNCDGLMVADGTWTYKIPTIDTIPKQLNVQILNNGPNKKRVLSSKASGEPPLLLSSSVHCATRAAIKEARKQLCSWKGVNLDGSESTFQLDVPATMPVVKTLCGLDCVGSGVILDSSDETTTSTGGSQLESLSVDFRRKIVAAESAYEAKKTKEVAIMECKELEFFLIDTDGLPERKTALIKKKQESILAKYNQE
ncbi:abscisic aldehyde oxidase 3 [Tanacetum coccineum]